MSAVEAEVRDSHAELYRSIWSDDPRYGTALEWVEDTVMHRIGPFMRRLWLENKLDLPASVVDFGAGDGRYLLQMHVAGLTERGVGIDYHGQPYSPLAPGWLNWIEGDIATVSAPKADFALSADVLEHLPPAKVPQVLTNMRECARHGWARISLIPDPYGKTRGLPELHESLFPAKVWLELLRTAGMEIREYRVYFENDAERALEVGW